MLKPAVAFAGMVVFRAGYLMPRQAVPAREAATITEMATFTTRVWDSQT
jgi:hypothetical protein